MPHELQCSDLWPVRGREHTSHVPSVNPDTDVYACDCGTNVVTPASPGSARSPDGVEPSVWDSFE